MEHFAAVFGSRPRRHGDIGGRAVTTASVVRPTTLTRISIWLSLLIVVASATFLIRRYVELPTSCRFTSTATASRTAGVERTPARVLLPGLRPDRAGPDFGSVSLLLMRCPARGSIGMRRTSARRRRRCRATDSPHRARSSGSRPTRRSRWRRCGSASARSRRALHDSRDHRVRGHGAGVASAPTSGWDGRRRDAFNAAHWRFGHSTR